MTVYVPDIGGLLPVFVYDEYAGFEVKTFPELSEPELERYLDANVAAVRNVLEAIGGVEAALANHLVMGPAILARAGLRFAAKIHGSDLTYTVRPHRERFLPYAREGMRAASAALVGSSHTARDLLETLELPGLAARTRLGPPGLDPQRFRLRERSESAERLQTLADSLREAAAPGDGSHPFGRDPSRAADAVSRWAQAGDGRRVVYVGKLLEGKGVELLLAAWPLVAARIPGARLLLAGFGGFEQELRQIWNALERGEAGSALRLAGGARLEILRRFLAAVPSGYEEMGRRAAGSVGISGRLEHSEVAEVVTAADALVAPSTKPEAFGMVAAEAAAAGALPIVARHSGLAEVAAGLGSALPAPWARLLAFDLDGDPVPQLAERLESWLAAAASERAPVAASISARATELWSWERVAEGVISASSGDLQSLGIPDDIVEALQ